MRNRLVGNRFKLEEMTEVAVGLALVHGSNTDVQVVRDQDGVLRTNRPEFAGLSSTLPGMKLYVPFKFGDKWLRLWKVEAMTERECQQVLDNAACVAIMPIVPALRLVPPAAGSDATI